MKYKGIELKYEVIPCTDAARKTIEEAADADVG